MKTDDISKKLEPELPDRIRWDENIPEDLKKRILDAVMPSTYMRRYLMEQEIRPTRAAGLIFKSPVSLQKKAALIGELAEHEDFWCEALEAMQEYSGHIPKETYLDMLQENRIGALHERLQEAIRNLTLKDREIFYLTDAWYDEDYHDEHDDGFAAVTSFQAAKEAACRNFEFEEWTKEDAWVVLDKYIPAEKGQMTHTWQYYMVGGEVIYFKKIDYDEYDSSTRKCSNPYYGDGDGGYLEERVPFRIGNILSVGSPPFSPEKPGVLIENDHEFTEVLCQSNDERWMIANLQHSMEWLPLYMPILSSIYQIRPYDKTLSDEEKILQKVSSLLSGNEKTGHRFWNAFHMFADTQKDGDLDEEELCKAIKEVEGSE